MRLALFLALFFSAPLFAMPPTGNDDDHWIGIWGTAPYGPYPAGPLQGVVPSPYDSITSPGAFDGEQARNQSFRMIVHPSRGGSVLRLRFSNIVGSQPVKLGTVLVSRRFGHAGVTGDLIQSGLAKEVFFAGQQGVSIPAGEEVKSDPVEFTLADQEDLVVSFHIEGDSGPMTWHAVSFDLNYISAPNSGDVTGDPTGAQFPHATSGWFFLSGVDADVSRELGVASRTPETVVALGDSITDGAYQVPATNTRWPDLLADRLPFNIGVLNKGINSNRVTGGPSANSGDAALLRFDRDVLAQSGVRSLVLFEGTNDITANVQAEEIYAGLTDLVDRAQRAGLCVVIGTIPPRDDVMFGWQRDRHEPVRQALNAMIRSNTEVEGIVEFDHVLALPGQPDRPNPAYFFPDLLHPNSAGFRIMADAVPVAPLLSPENGGSCERVPPDEEDDQPCRGGKSEHARSGCREPQSLRKQSN